MTKLTRNRTSIIAALAACALAGCGSGHGLPGGNGSLAGTWDIMGTQGSTSRMGMLTWSANSVSITYGRTTVTVAIAGDTGTGTWQESSSSAGITIRHSGAGMDTGAIPFGLGGRWTLTSNQSSSQQCMASLDSESFSNSCSSPSTYIPGLGSVATQMTARRTAQASSIFGDFGGTWTFQAGDLQCTAGFVASTITVQCSRSGRSEGSFSATVAGDVVSGTSSLGFEFSARKRS